MSNDRFTEVSHQSWFSRIGGAFKGIVAGLILFALAFPLLFWNEGRAVKRHKTLEEGGGAVISVSSETIDPSNDGNLIHVTGKALTGSTLNDPVFGVSVNGLKLKRVVSMYQWQESTESETKKKLGGSTETVTTYSYNKTWSEHPIDSSRFKNMDNHRNPSGFPYEPLQLTADDITLGAFSLSPSLAAKLTTYTPLPVGHDSPLPEALHNRGRLHDGGYYLGEDPLNPQIGDIQVKFQVMYPAEISVVSGQQQDTFSPYRTSAGGSIELLEQGLHSAEAMFAQAKQSNTILTWVLRLAGLALMALGLTLILRPLSVLADVLPILGNLTEAGIGLVSWLLAAILSLTTIAVAWVFYRPIVAVVLMIIAAAITFLFRKRVKTPPPIPPTA